MEFTLTNGQMLIGKHAPEIASVLDAVAGSALAQEVLSLGPLGPFDFGAARDAHERRWPPELQDALVALLMTLPAPYRAYVRRALYSRITARTDHGPVTTDDLARLWAELAASSGLSAGKGGNP